MYFTDNNSRPEEKGSSPGPQPQEAVALPALALQHQDSGWFDASGPNGADPEKKGALRGPMLAWPWRTKD